MDERVIYIFLSYYYAVGGTIQILYHKSSQFETIRA